MDNPKLIKRIKVPSKTSPGEVWTPELYSDGMMVCDCPRIVKGIKKEEIYCRHKRALVWTLIRDLEKSRMHKIFDIHEAKKHIANRMPKPVG